MLIIGSYRIQDEKIQFLSQKKYNIIRKTKTIIINRKLLFLFGVDLIYLDQFKKNGSKGNKNSLSKIEVHLKAEDRSEK